MNAGTKCWVKVNGLVAAGAYMHPIKGKKNRHCVAVKYKDWRRDHWVTVSSKKLVAA